MGVRRIFARSPPNLIEKCVKDFTGFSGILLTFQQIKTLECALPPAPPPTTPLPLENPLLALVWKNPSGAHV